ncbi:MAG: hypothetical protein K5756_02805 [Clostridiales bacterium]|nr:hypothetical protein [Clostridiales bacterium]
MDVVFYNECKERLTRISESMLLSNQAFCVIKQLLDFKDNQKDLINISPSFYTCVFDTCTSFLLIEICKMFDSDQNSNGIYGLLNTIKGKINLLDNNREIQANEIMTINDDTAKTQKYENITQFVRQSKKRINSHNAVIDSVKTLRNKYYAHSDNNVNFDDLFKDNPVSISDIESLLVLNVNLINGLYAYFNDSTLFPTFIGCDDFKKTIRYIEKGAEAYRKELDAK